MKKRTHGFWLLQLLLLMQLGLLIIFKTGYYNSSDFIITASWWTLAFVLIIICHQFFILYDRNWMSLGLMFFIPYWLVFYLVPLREKLDHSFVNSKSVKTASLYWPDVVYLASLSIICFMIGFSFVSRKGMQIYSSGEKLNNPDNKKIFLRTAWILLVFSVISFTAFLICGGYKMYKGGYVHVNHLGWMVGFIYILYLNSFRSALCSWTIFVFFFDKFRLCWLVPAFLFLSMLLTIVLSGDRGLLAWSAVSVIAIISQKRRIRAYEIGLVLLTASIVFAFVQEYRVLEEKSFVKAFDNLKDQKLWPILGLTQFSEALAPTVTNAFAIVEEKGHFNGMFLAQDALSVLPFYTRIFPWLPAAKDRAMRNTGSFVTRFVTGDNRSGLATTLVTDLYLNVSVPLVLFFMILYGMLGGILYNKRSSGEFMTGLFCYAIFFPGFMGSVRGPYLLVGRFLWEVLIFIVALKISIWSNKLRIKATSDQAASGGMDF